ncbi:MAG: cytochrome c family protein [Pararhodobacter sp.]
MFDTMVITKAVAALCATLLIFLLGKWAAESIYMPGHDAEHAHAVYPLPAEEGDGHDAAPVEEEVLDIAALLASADAAAGQGLWRNCQSCHKLDGTNGTGPHLDGVVGRAIDSVEGYNYSGALMAMGEIWTPEALVTFLINPREAAPGTRMSFRGFSNPQDAANMAAYLQTVSN